MTVTSEQKIVNVVEQIQAICRGEQGAEICCPFCGVVTTAEQEVLCCDELAEVVLATVNNEAFRSQMRIVDSALDRASRN